MVRVVGHEPSRVLEPETEKTKADPHVAGHGPRIPGRRGDQRRVARIAFVLAVASAVAVGYLVFTAPNKDSPQFQRRDGLDAVKLGVVDEVGEAPNVA